MIVNLASFVFRATFNINHCCLDIAMAQHVTQRKGIALAFCHEGCKGMAQLMGRKVDLRRLFQAQEHSRQRSNTQPPLLLQCGEKIVRFNASI